MHFELLRSRFSASPKVKRAVLLVPLLLAALVPLSDLGALSETNLLSSNSNGIEQSAAGWTAQGNTEISRTTKVSYAGKASLRVRVARRGYVDSSRTARVGTTLVTATPGTGYLGSARVRPNEMATRVRCEIRWYDDARNIISTFEGASFVSEAAKTWVQPTCAATAPASTSYAALRLYFDNVDYGRVHFVDDAWLSVSTVQASSAPTTAAAAAPPTTTTAPPTTTTAPPTTTTAPPTTTTAPPTTTTAPPDPGTARYGFPGASNTGVPAGTVLRPSGTITITTPGTVISGLDVTGCVFVRASNVTIRNTRVRGSCFNGAIDTGFGEHSGILVENVEIDGQNRSATDIGIGYSGYTCRRCNIHHIGGGARMATDVVIEDSWIHDIYSANGSHNSGIGSNGGWNFTVRRNNLDCGTADGCSGALVMYGDFDPISNVLIEGNLFNGGGYCTYGGSVAGKPYPNATNVRYLNNRFRTDLFSGCGYWGPVASFNKNGSGNQWSGNVWHESGAPI